MRAPVPWEQRVRPAPSVKNSGATGTTASSCCRRAGFGGSQTPGLVTRRGPGGEGGWRGDPQSPGGHSIPRVRASLVPRVLGVSPQIPGGFPGYLALPTPDPGTFTQRGASRAPSSSQLVRQNSSALLPPPTDALENSAPTRLSWWRTGWAFTLEWGGIQGPRRPQLPGAPGCTNASPRSPSTGSRPASRAGEEPRPRPVQPRPIRAAPGSPPQGFGC